MPMHPSLAEDEITDYIISASYTRKLSYLSSFRATRR